MKIDVRKLIEKNLVSIIYIATSLIYLYFAAFGISSDMTNRALLISLLCPTVLLTKHLKLKGKEVKPLIILDYLIALAFLASGIYIMVVFPVRILKVGATPVMDIVMGAIMVVCVLEVTRRTTGKFMSILSICFIIYAFIGPIMPGMLGHRGETFKRLMTFMYVSTEGVFGVPAGIAATYIMAFVIFGAFLEEFGTGQWFVDFAYSTTGRFRGGPAKTAVIASALMGMISGSSAANVVTTGTFTIPLMKRTGYKGYEAGAVEAVASTGGMFTPPIMGAGAFIMAEYVGISYGKVALAATVPAFLYYVSILLAVDALAVKHNLKGLPATELPSIGKIMKERGLLALPIFVLIGLIIYGFSPMKSAVYSLLSVLVVASFNKETRPNLKKILNALENGSKSIASIICTCACAGIIVGVLSITGLGAKLSYTMISIAHGNIYLGALITALITILLGCGMPAAAVYVVLASILAPSLVEMGAEPLAAHMFIFFFSCIGTITPPVAITSYTAAAIAEADATKTGWTAFFMGIVAFIIPFIFLTSPALILIGNTTDIVIALITATVGVFCLVACIEGYLFMSFRIIPRVLLGIAAICTLIPGLVTDLIGIGCLIVAVIINLAFRSKPQGIGQ